MHSLDTYSKTWLMQFKGPKTYRIMKNIYNIIQKFKIKLAKSLLKKLLLLLSVQYVVTVTNYHFTW